MKQDGTGRGAVERRGFLKGLGLAAGGVAGAVAAVGAEEQGKGEPPEGGKETNEEMVRQRYREIAGSEALLRSQPPLAEGRPMLVKRKAGGPLRQNLAETLAAVTGGSVSRRAFLERSGLAAGGLAAVASLPRAMVRKAEAGPVRADVTTEVRKNVCTHCSVGCTVIAEVQNGVWVGQEPGWDSPISQGTHCAKGAAVRELIHGERRVKYPMKLVAGEWKRIGWDQAIDEIGDKLLGDPREVRRRTRCSGSARPSSPTRPPTCSASSPPSGAPTTVDHQARICHSTTVAGVANTWGYGAHDQQLQRHPELEAHDHHRRQPGRGAPGLDAAHAARQGAQQGATSSSSTRASPAPRRTPPSTSASAPAPTSRSSGACSGTSSRMAGRTRSIIHQRVYGMDEIRAEVEEVDPRGGRAGDRRARRQLRTHRRGHGEEQAGDADLVHGRDAEDGRHGQCARLQHPPAGARQYRRRRRRGQHLPRPHQRPGRHRHGLGRDHACRSYYGLDEGAWRHWARVWEVDLRLDEGPLRLARS